MTYLEKAGKIHPNLSKREIIFGFCPSNFDLGIVVCQKTCFDCWNREMPEKEG